MNGAPWWALILLSVATVAGSVLAARLTGRSSERVAQITTGPDTVATYSRLVDDLSDEIERLKKAHSASSARIDELVEQRRSDSARIDQLERKVRDEERKFRAAIRYIRHLQKSLADAGLSVPTPPTDLHLSLDT